jgi:hypothetical protein
MTKELKVRNHQVTKCLINKWSSSHDGKHGTFFYDITKQKKGFSQGNESSFAIEPYLYVPIQGDGVRNDDLENEFSVDEAALGHLIKSAMSSGHEIRKINIARKAIRSCISMGYRSSYYTAMTAMMLHEHGVPQGRVHLDTINIMKRSIYNRYEKFKNWRFIVIKNIDGDLLINEQPFRDWTTHRNPYDLVTMPLTPRSLLIGGPSPNGNFSLEWTGVAHDKINVNNHNNFIIETARHFVAARTEKQLDDAIPMLNESAVKQRMITDRIFEM